MGALAPEHLLIIAIIAFFLFGAKKLPELARSLGRSSSEFKKGLKEGAAEQDSKPASEGPSPDTAS